MKEGYTERAAVGCRLLLLLRLRAAAEMINRFENRGECVASCARACICRCVCERSARLVDRRTRRFGDSDRMKRLYFNEAEASAQLSYSQAQAHSALEFEARRARERESERAQSSSEQTARIESGSRAIERGRARTAPLERHDRTTGRLVRRRRWRRR